MDLSDGGDVKKIRRALLETAPLLLELFQSMRLIIMVLRFIKIL